MKAGNDLKKMFWTLFLMMLGIAQTAWAQNPLIRDQFTADPSARVFNGKVYVFPSHDIPAPEGKNLRKNWFCMEDYHVFSSENLVDWTDHGTIVSQYDASWIDSTSYSMWAPDCVERNGKYYFYFPAQTSKSGPDGTKGFGIGVAVADQPEGPYRTQNEAIEGVLGIDPNVLIDKDGQAYLYWSHRHIYVARLKDNMLELDSEQGLKEGPWGFERNGIYYLTFPHVENKIERLEYAVGDSPMGPFAMKGVIMDESPVGCWTNHHSIVEYNGQWYLFYHHNDYSPEFDKNRSIRVDSLSFNTDGTIQKVKPSLRGVGITLATSKIDVDRYSQRSEQVEIAFLDPANKFKGWKTILSEKNDWIQYNAVDFGNGNLKSCQIKVRAETGGQLQLRLDGVNGPVLTEIEVPAGSTWQLLGGKLSSFYPGVHHLLVVSKSDQPVELDWVQFGN
jgi:GH43 family beta-xylosidase